MCPPDDRHPHRGPPICQTGLPAGGVGGPCGRALGQHRGDCHLFPAPLAYVLFPVQQSWNGKMGSGHQPFAQIEPSTWNIHQHSSKYLFPHCLGLSFPIPFPLWGWGGGRAPSPQSHCTVTHYLPETGLSGSGLPALETVSILYQGYPGSPIYNQHRAWPQQKPGWVGKGRGCPEPGWRAVGEGNIQGLQCSGW